jgi:hypothetical protein
MPVVTILVLTKVNTRALLMSHLRELRRHRSLAGWLEVWREKKPPATWTKLYRFGTTEGARISVVIGLLEEVVRSR